MYKIEVVRDINGFTRERMFPLLISLSALTVDRMKSKNYNDR